MAEKSALRLIPGKDALLQYTPAVYPPITYVEYQGSVYKSLITTSPTFVPTEWELISDPRTPRVPNITSRNALTGSTPTSGTTGIHIPILDNTDVLVLDAIGDPQVAAHKFAIYNYNKTTNTFLLLQVSTGSTSSNVSDYNLLSNKPPIISGVTATAGAGLTGGGVFSGGVPPTRATFTFAHADTSSQTNFLPTGLTYVQQLRFDTFGHVTGGTTSTWVHPDTSGQPSINGTGFTYIQNIGLDTDGHVISLGQSTWVHPDTSTQGDVINTGNTVIQSIILDTDGHVTGINSVTVSGGGGGGGVNFNVVGDVGANVPMPNGGVLTITGGSNIQTVSTLHANRVGVRINVLPAGSNNQIQINNSGVLGASPNLLFTGGTTLLANKYAITSTPVSGSTNDQFVTRNPINGNLQYVGIGSIERAIVAQPANSVQFANVNGLFSGSSQFIFDPTKIALTLGIRPASTIGQNSFVIGTTSNIATGNTTIAFGQNITAGGTNSFAGGSFITNVGSSSLAFGFNSKVLGGTGAIALGSAAQANGFGAIALGVNVKSLGTGSIAAGFGGAGTEVTAQNGGIAISNNSSTPSPARPGVGASASWSGIFAGLNHSIDTSSVGATIIGGHKTGTGSPGLNISGSTYQDFVNVSNLAIWTTPSAGGTDDVLTWNTTTKKIGKVTQASLSGGGGGTPAGANGYVQIRNNSAAFDATPNLIFLTGTSTLSTSNLNLGSTPASGNTSDLILVRNTGTGNIRGITYAQLAAPPVKSVQFNSGSGLSGSSVFIYDSPTAALTLGNRSIGTLGQYSLSVGAGNIASGTDSVAFGSVNTASGFYAAAFGNGNIASNQGALAIGQITTASGQFSFAGGTGNIGTTKPVVASGQASFNFSVNTITQSAGHAAAGQFSAILGGQNHNISGGSTNSIVIGGSANKINSTSALQSAILGGSSNVITGSTSNSAIISSSSSKLYGSVSSIIVGGISNSITGLVQRSAIVGGASNQLVTTGASNQFHTGIFAGQLNKILGLTDFSTIIGGGGNLISGATSTQYNSIVGANSSQIKNGAFYTAIVGGATNSISAAQRAVIVGGQNIKLTGTSQNDNVVVPNLMLWTTPSAGNTDDVLTWNSVTKKVGKVTQLSLGNRYKNVAWVSISGGTGQVGNIFSPYSSIQSAINAVASAMGSSLSRENRGLVIIMPGRYDVSNNPIATTNYIDLYLNSADIYAKHTSIIAGLFSFPIGFTDISIDGNNGKLSMGNGSLSNGVLTIGQIGAGSNVRINLDEISLTANTGTFIPAIGTMGSNFDFNFKCKRIMGNSNTLNGAIQANGSKIIIDVDYMASTVELNGGGGEFRIKKLYGSIFFNNVSGGKTNGGTTNYYGDIIYTGTTSNFNYALMFNGYNVTNGPTILNYYGNVICSDINGAASLGFGGTGVTSNCRIRIDGSIKNINGGNAPALKIISSHVALIGGTYLVASGSGSSITASPSSTIYLYGTSVANTAVGGGVTTAIGTLIVDPNVV